MASGWPVSGAGWRTKGKGGWSIFSPLPPTSVSITGTTCLPPQVRSCWVAQFTVTAPATKIHPPCSFLQLLETVFAPYSCRRWMHPPPCFFSVPCPHLISSPFIRVSPFELSGVNAVSCCTPTNILTNQRVPAMPCKIHWSGIKRLKFQDWLTLGKSLHFSAPSFSYLQRGW